MIFQASKPQPIVQSGWDKFAPLVSSLAPFLIPAWSAALQAVNCSLLFQQVGHYTFPDPGLFIGAAKKAKFIEIWLQAHEAWIVCVVHNGSLAMSGQSWHDFLATDLGSFLDKGDTKAARHRKCVLDTLTPKSLSNPEVKVWSNAGEPFFWQGYSYPPGVLHADHVFQQILWELYELNFTHEFFFIGPLFLCWFGFIRQLKVVQMPSLDLRMLCGQCFQVYSPSRPQSRIGCRQPPRPPPISHWYGSCDAVLERNQTCCLHYHKPITIRHF